jgi:hypothetical protein
LKVIEGSWMVRSPPCLGEPEVVRFLRHPAGVWNPADGERKERKKERGEEGRERRTREILASRSASKPLPWPKQS